MLVYQDRKYGNGAKLFQQLSKNVDEINTINN